LFVLGDFFDYSFPELDDPITEEARFGDVDWSFAFYESLGFSSADDFSGQDVFPFFVSFPKLNFLPVHIEWDE